MKFTISVLSLVGFAAISADAVYAITIDIETVFVGNAGNADDTHSNGYGAVDYDFRIGKYEITNNQYVDFLNAIDPMGANELELYFHAMKNTKQGGIIFDNEKTDGAKYLVKPDRDQLPVVFVNWYDSIRFANWMHNGQGTGDTETGAYTILGGTPIPSDGLSITRNPGAKWFLPSQDEWYKAAYHKNNGVTGDYWDYPTSTNMIPYSDQPDGGDTPDPTNTGNFYADDEIDNGYNDGFALTGSTFFSWTAMPLYLTPVGAYSSAVSPYGTYDQGGNVWEWNEAIRPDERRGRRGGNYGGSSRNGELWLRAKTINEDNPLHQHGKSGFRIAAAYTLLQGDYNDDGIVDAADYTVWRDNYGSSVTLPGDSTPGAVTEADYDVWRSNFGNTTTQSSTFGATIPEPGTLLLGSLAALGLLVYRKQKDPKRQK